MADPSGEQLASIPFLYGARLSLDWKSGQSISPMPYAISYMYVFAPFLLSMYVEVIYLLKLFR